MKYKPGMNPFCNTKIFWTLLIVIKVVLYAITIFHWSTSLEIAYLL